MLIALGILFIIALLVIVVIAAILKAAFKLFMAAPVLAIILFILIMVWL